MRYFALACDYDGTIAQDGRVDDQTIEALERVAATGRMVVLVTGRELPDLFKVFDRPDVFEWIVAENGALLYSPSSREEVRLSEHIPPEFVAELHRRGVEPLREGRVIVATWHPNETTVLETIRDLGLELQVIFNKGAVMVLPAGVHKGTGLAAALGRMGLSRHNVAGIGDAENDHAFLSTCEFSAAVANALPQVKERADFVTARDHGAGVREVAEALVEDDLAGLCEVIERHLLPVGRTDDGEEVTVRPFGPSILIAGTSGAGKSTLAKVLLERLSDREYQFCIVDPEGDYEGFEEGVVLGTQKRPPAIEEVTQLLEQPSQNAVVNMLGLPIDDRPAFFARLLTTITELRARTGRPHWVIVDEAHHLMPVGWEPASVALPKGLYGMLLITVHPDLVSDAAVGLIDTIATVGETPAQMIDSFARRKGAKAPALPRGALPTGEALIWTTGERRPKRFRISETRLQHQRHRRKYAEGDLGDRSFFFTGPRAKLHLRAQNLFLFLQLAEGLDDETWDYHLRRGDYTRWFAEGVKNPKLAEAAEAVRKEAPDAEASRERIREAIEEHYTLPAAHKPAIDAPPQATKPGSARPKAAERNKNPRRKPKVDPVQMIKEDHAKVKQLFQAFEQSKEDLNKMKLIAEEAIVELQIHEQLEEEIFYPAMRAGDETKELVTEAEEEHHVVDLLIQELLKMKPQDEHYPAKFMVMAENVRHHITEEEGEMLPKARQLLGSRYEQIGDQMKKRKDKLVGKYSGKPRTVASRSRATSSSSRSTSSRGRRTATAASSRSRSRSKAK